MLPLSVYNTNSSTCTPMNWLKTVNQLFIHLRKVSSLKRAILHDDYIKTLLCRIHKSESLISTCKILSLSLFSTSSCKFERSLHFFTRTPILFRVSCSWSSLASPICSLSTTSRPIWLGRELIGFFFWGCILQIIFYFKFPIYLRSKILRVSCYFGWLGDLTTLII